MNMQTPKPLCDMCFSFGRDERKPATWTQPSGIGSLPEYLCDECYQSAGAPTATRVEQPPKMIYLSLYLDGAGVFKFQCKESEREEFGNELRDVLLGKHKRCYTFRGYGVTFDPYRLVAFRFSDSDPFPPETDPLTNERRAFMEQATRMFKLLEAHERDGDDWKHSE